MDYINKFSNNLLIKKRNNFIRFEKDFHINFLKKNANNT